MQKPIPLPATRICTSFHSILRKIFSEFHYRRRCPPCLPASLRSPPPLCSLLFSLLDNAISIAPARSLSLSPSPRPSVRPSDRPRCNRVRRSREDRANQISEIEQLVVPTTPSLPRSLAASACLFTISKQSAFTGREGGREAQNEEGGGGGKRRTTLFHWGHKIQQAPHRLIPLIRSIFFRQNCRLRLDVGIARDGESTFTHNSGSRVRAIV